MKAAKNAWLGAAVILMLCPAAALAQQSSQSSPAQPKPQPAANTDQKAKPAAAKSAKVWTDDDISSLRTPEDIYLDQQARAAQDAAAANPSQPAPAANSAVVQSFARYSVGRPVRPIRRFNVVRKR